MQRIGLKLVIVVSNNIAIIAGGRYLASFRMLLGGSRFENSKKGKALVPNVIKLATKQAISACEISSGILLFLPMKDNEKQNCAYYCYKQNVTAI